LESRYESIRYRIRGQILLKPHLHKMVYRLARNDLTYLFYFIRGGFGLYSFYLVLYLVLLPGVSLAVALILYKKALKNKPSRLNNMTLMTLKLVFGLIILVMFFLAGGFIWLLPVISLLIAIQYQHIFLDSC
jgi:hypothetical protein